MAFEQSIEKGVATSRIIEGRKVLFGILTMRDLGVLRSQMPEAERKGATLNDVWWWCKSPDGILALVALSAQKYDPIFTEDQANELELIVGLKELAEEIQEASAGKPKASAEGNAATTSTTT
jgi:hypothetical protein